MKKNTMIILLAIGGRLLSQSNPDYAFDSKLDTYLGHSTYQFSRIAPSEVNEYNGTAEIFIPLHSIKFEGLNIPIGLRYNSSGIKVNQYATEVGLGWSLDAGGAVVKEINGKYEDNVLQQNDYPYNLYDGGYLSDPNVQEVPDFYKISAPGLSSHFLIDNTFQVREIDNSKTCDISFVLAQDSNQTKDKYGLYEGHNGAKVRYLGLEPLYRKETQSIKAIKNKFTYDFGEWNHTHRRTYTRDNNYQGPNNIYAESNSESYYHPDYLLTEITDNTTKKKVLFKYLETAAINPNIVDLSRTWDKMVYQTDDTGGATNNYYHITNYTSTSTEWYVKKMIQEIITDSETIKFNYENLRDDLTVQDILFSSSTHSQNIRAPFLKSIEIKNNSSNTVVKHVFNYDYFNSGCNDTPLCKRLKLIGIDTYYNGNSTYQESHTFNYNTSTSMPKIGSLAQDAYGNKISLSESQVSEASGPKRPNLYKYTELVDGNTFDYFSTIKVPALNPVWIAGQFDLPTATLEEAKAWTLTSISYPTKGLQTFEYEQNSFNWKGSILNGGGLRIKSITLNGGNGTETTSYKYSEGQVAALAQFTLKESLATGPYGSIITSIPQTSVARLVNSRNYVTYPTVEKTLPNNSKIINVYTSLSDFPESEEVKYYPSPNSGNTVISNLGIHLFSVEKMNSGLYSNNNFLRGKLKSSHYYDQTGKLLKKIINNYEPKSFPFSMYRKSFDYHYLNDLYCNYSQDPNFTSGEPVIRSYNLVSSDIYTVFDTKEVLEKYNFSYTDNYNLPKAVKTTASTADSYETNSLYAFESSNATVLNTPELRQIKVEDTQLKNNKVISKTTTTYAQNSNTSNLVLPVSVSSYDVGSGGMVPEIRYDKLDSKGNIIQYTPKNSNPITVIWGYNQTLPIAKIEGGSYAQTMQAFGLNPDDLNAYKQLEIVKKSDLDIDDSTETSLINELESFKKKTDFKNFKITVYTYDPLVGVKAIISPSGLKETYKYDTANRLARILDMDGNILKENKYNYAPKTFYSSAASPTLLRNNCGGSAIGGSYTYMVPEGKYTSIISQADAEQQVQNDIAINGQAAANLYGTCTPLNCSVTKGSGISQFHYGSISLNNPSEIRVQMGFRYFSNLPWNTGVVVGKISGTCVPSGERSSSTYANGIWSLTIDPSGNIIAKISSASPSLVNDMNLVFDFTYSIQ